MIANGALMFGKISPTAPDAPIPSCKSGTLMKRRIKNKIHAKSVVIPMQAVTRSCNVTLGGIRRS